MKQDRIGLFLGPLERLDQQAGIVAVDRAEVMQAELLENQARHQQSLDGFLEAVTDPFQVVAHPRDAFDEVFQGLMSALVGRMGGDAVEVICQRPDVLGDAPLVVIEDHRQALGALGDVVQRFKGDPVGKRGIAADGHDVFIGAGLVAGNGHAECGGQRGAGMAGPVTVVLALGTVGEAHRPARLADLVEIGTATGQEFVDVDLVTDIPDEPVAGALEHAVKRDGELDHAQVGTEMAAGPAQGGDDLVADLRGEFFQLFHRQQLHVCWRVDHVKITSHDTILLLSQ